MMHVIYVPGLGDTERSIRKQRFATSLWRFYGVTPHLFHMDWGDDRDFDEKFAELLELIDDSAKQGPVSLVGASAGATAVINAYAARLGTVNGVVCIAGKINNPQTISQSYQRRHPSFMESGAMVGESLKKLDSQARRRILSIRSPLDLWVPARDSILPGAYNRTTWTSGHAATIANQLVLGAPFWLRFLKKQITTGQDKD